MGKKNPALQNARRGHPDPFLTLKDIAQPSQDAAGRSM